MNQWFRSILVWALLQTVDPAGCWAEATLAQPPPGPQPTNSPLEEFKEFLSNPPTIANLLVQRKVPMGGGFRAYDGTFALSTEFTYYEGKRQPGAIFFRKLKSLWDATNAVFDGELASSFGETNWIVYSKPAFITWNDMDPDAKGKNYSVYFTRRLLLGPLNQVLNLGILHVPPATTRWNGNQFAIRDDSDGDVWTIGGILVPGTDGRADHLTVSYTHGTETDRYVVRYGYRPSLRLPYVPTVITNFWVSTEGKEFDVDEWTILNLEVAPKPLLAPDFSIDRLMISNRWPTLVFKDRAYFTLQTNGTLTLLMAAPPEAATQRPRSDGTRLFYVGWVGFNFALFTLFVRVKNTKTQTQNKERYNEKEIS